MAVTPASDISAIKGYIEKYDRNLINQMLNGLDIATDLPVIRNVREPKTLYKMTVDEGARPLNTEIETAKGGRSWSRRVLTPGRGMKIIKMIPEELRETFMSEMLDINAPEVAFHEWVWEQEFAKISEEINDNFYRSRFHGDPDQFSPTATYAVGELVYFQDIIYAAKSTTTAGESPASAPDKWEDVDNQVICEGPDAIIEKAISQEGLVPVGQGTFDETDAYAYFKEMWGNVTEAHKNRRMTAYVSFDTAQKLTENVNSRFGSGKGIGGVDIEEGVPFRLRDTGGRLTIKPVTWMLNSQRVIMTPVGNLVVGMNQTGDANKVGKMVHTLHGYRAIVKYMLGTQFRDLELLYVNDQR